MKNYMLLSVFPILFLPFAVFCQTETGMQEALKEHVRILSSEEFEGRGPGSKGIELAREYIAGQFEKKGLMPLDTAFYHEFKYKTGLSWVRGKNIAGYFPGTNMDRKDEVILIGAHYDHLGYDLIDGDKVIFPGADDNASGVAVMLELISLLYNVKDELGRTVVFVAFDAGECCQLGSRAFLTDHVIDPDRIKVMYNLNRVGMLEQSGHLKVPGSETLTSRGFYVDKGENARIRLRN